MREDMDDDDYKMREIFAGIVDAPLIEEHLAKVDSMKDDYGLAHWMADCIHQGLLLAIAEGRCLDPVECCKLAMETDLIPFTRWYE